MRWAITGARGFIGRQVVAQLNEQGSTVLGLSRSGGANPQVAGAGVTWLPGNWLAADWTPEPETQADVLAHLAGPSAWSVLGAAAVYDEIMTAAQRAWAVAGQLGVRQFVYVSSAAALGGESRGRPIQLDRDHWPYAAGKREAEAWLRTQAQAQSVGFSVVYPGEVYGPGDVDEVTSGTLKAWLRERCVLVTDGGTHVAHVADVARAITEGGTKPQTVFVGREYVTFAALARLTRQLGGRSGPVLTVPYWIAQVGLKVRRLTGIDLVQHPDAAVQYAQVHWRKPAAVPFFSAEQHDPKTAIRAAIEA